MSTASKKICVFLWVGFLGAVALKIPGKEIIHNHSKI
jgi:hypothetical protein